MYTEVATLETSFPVTTVSASEDMQVCTTSVGTGCWSDGFTSVTSGIVLSCSTGGMLIASVVDFHILLLSFPESGIVSFS